MKYFSIIIPAYNEEKNLPILIQEILDNLINKEYIYEIIIIDDCSDDNTIETLNKYRKFDKLKIIQNKINFGQSKSIQVGIKNSLYNNIVTIDADLQNDPRDILKIAKIYFQNNYSMVAGIRNKRKDNIIKIISSKVANAIRSIILKDKCPDTGCSLKIFEKKIFLNFKFFDGIHRFLPALFIGNNYDIKYVNVNHRPRIYGVSNYGTFLRIIWGIRDIIRVKKMIKQNSK